MEDKCSIGSEKYGEGVKSKAREGTRGTYNHGIATTLNPWWIRKGLKSIKEQRGAPLSKEERKERYR